MAVSCILNGINQCLIIFFLQRPEKILYIRQPQKTEGKALMKTYITIAMLIFASVGFAQKAKWNVITLLSANYDHFNKRLEQISHTDDVRVLVLHDRDGKGLDAYEVISDGSDQGITKPIPLVLMGINPKSPIYDPVTISNFLQYIAANYPADHHLFSFRGQMRGPRFLLHDSDREGGIVISQLQKIFSQFNQATGKKIDVVNFGFCFGATIDWAYALSPYADHFVASPNYTNSPVAMRWRNYRWISYLQENPDAASGALASEILRTFTMDTPYCLKRPHLCSNSPKQPWSISHVDLSTMPTFINESKKLLCSLSKLPPAQINSLLQNAAIRSTNYTRQRIDLYDFMTQLDVLVNQQWSVPFIPYLTSLKKVLAEAYFEPDFYAESAGGVSGYLPTVIYPRQMGPYYRDSGWSWLASSFRGFQLGSNPCSDINNALGE